MTTAYTRTAVALHWIVAALVITAITMGWAMTEMEFSPLKLRLFNWHKWVGVTVLALMLVRSFWRLTHRPPAPLPMPAWQHLSSRVVHALLYVMLLVQPLTGWIYSNASGIPIVYLGLIPLPNLVNKDKALDVFAKEIHDAGGWVLAVLIGLHLLAAIKHYYYDRDDTLRRMLRWQSS
jgi:cytochrome b561